MELIESVYSLPFQGLLRPPHLRFKAPSITALAELRPSAWTVFYLTLASYFLVTGGIIYGTMKSSQASQTMERI
jgi:hypothetical protein